MKYFEFSENNSGGSWWLDRDDYIALIKSGKWGVEKDALNDPYYTKMGTFLSEDVPYILRHNLIGGPFANESEAISSWESLTKQDVSAEGCGCCGSPFRLYETYGTWNEETKSYGPFDPSSVLFYSPENLELGTALALPA